MDVEQIESNSINSVLRNAVAALESKVRSGDTQATEGVLITFPDLAENREAILELIYTEYVLRQEQGAEVSLTEWESRFPHWTSDLRELFQVHQFLSNDDALGGSPAARRRRLRHLDGMGPLGRIGNCELLEEIGRGGMGIVYRARQTNLDRVVAVKTILGYGGSQRNARERFHTEVESVARLQHPHIVQIHEVGDEDGVPYFTMEFVSGGSLAGLVRERPLRPSTSAQLIECLARAVDYAHSQGVVHRDLKPENILLAPSSRSEAIFLGVADSDDTVGGSGASGYYEPKITDFGLAKRIDSDLQQTVDGAALGTPGYMAPEQTQIESSKIGAACDIYALGAVLYSILVGRPPFHAATSLETINQVRSEEPIPPRSLQPTVPRDLETICLKCLQKQPERRYVTAAELADDLCRFLNGEPIRARATSGGEKLRKWAQRHPSMSALLVAVGLGIVGVTWQWMRAEHNRGLAEREATAAKQARQAEHKEHQHAIRLQYAHDVQLARLQYASNNTTQALQLLDSCPSEYRNWEWHFVSAQCQQETRAFPTMSMMIRDLAWSPDGKLLAVVTGVWGVNQQGRLNVWEADTGRLRFSSDSHPSSIMAVRFTSDGKRLATAGVFWQHAPEVSGVKVWDATDGRELLAINDSDAFSIAFSPDDRMLAVGRPNGHIAFHDSDSGEELFVFKGHSLFASELSYRPDGKFLASAGRDGTLRVWNLETKQQFAVVTGLSDVRSVAYFPNGREIVMGTFGGTVKTYRQTDRELRETATLTRSNSLPLMRLSPDGMMLAVSATNQPITLLDVQSELDLRQVVGHNGYATAAGFSPDGCMIATGGADGIVKIWDLTKPVQPQQKSLGGPFIVDLAFDPGGQHLALASGPNTTQGGRGHTLRLWDLKSQRVTSTMSGHTDWLTSVAYDPRGSTLVTGSLDKTVRLWDPKAGQLLRTFAGHTHPVTAVAFAADNIASASGDGTVRIWVPDRGDVLLHLAHNGQPVVALAARRDGLIASATTESLWFWNGITGESRGRLDINHSDRVRLAFSSDGKSLAIASDHPTIDLYNVSLTLDRLACGNKEIDSKCKLQLVGHTGPVTGISFSPDGSRLMSTSDDRSLKCWSVATGQEVLGFSGPMHFDSRVAFSPDGTRLIQTGNSNIAVWQVSATKTDAVLIEPPAKEANLLRDWHMNRWRTADANRNWAAAAFHRSQLCNVDPDEPHHVTMRGLAYAQLGRLDEALADWDNGFDKFNQPNDRVVLSYRRALVRLLHEDTETYRQICQQLWKDHALTDNVDLENSIAWICSLGPDSGVPVDSYIELAERGVADKRISARLNTLGACLYRAKRYEEAITTFNESMKLQSKGGWPQDWAYLALSHHAVGNAETSREYLEKAIAWLAEQKQHEDSGEPTDAIFTWSTRIELEIVIREAYDFFARNDSTVAH